MCVLGPNTIKDRHTNIDGCINKALFPRLSVDTVVVVVVVVECYCSITPPHTGPSSFDSPRLQL